jgi:hypothetical protein
MKLQSAIEFLTTYGFMFIILAVLLSILVFIATAPQITQTTECNSYGSIMCNYISMYSNNPSGYSLLTMYLVNSQSVPVKIYNISSTIIGTKGAGACSPTTLSPGQGAVCLVSMQKSYREQSKLFGFYTINGAFCNSSPSSSSNCTYESASYGGSFMVFASPINVTIFSVTAAAGPTSYQTPAYGSSPGIPSNFSVTQNGDWIATKKPGFVGYAYGTSGYLGDIEGGLKVIAFPSSLSTLSNGNIACSYPYNTTYSVAYTMLYNPSSTSFGVNVVTDDAIAVYYNVTNSNTWDSVLGNSAWHGNSGVPYNGVMTLPSGFSSVAVEWANICSGGAQAFWLNTT